MSVHHVIFKLVRWEAVTHEFPGLIYQIHSRRSEVLQGLKRSSNMVCQDNEKLSARCKGFHAMPDIPGPRLRINVAGIADVNQQAGINCFGRVHSENIVLDDRHF